MKKIVYWLGKTPEGLNDMDREGLMDYFGYMYEFYWIEEFIKKHGKVSEYLKGVFKSFKEQNLSNERLWWATIMTIQKDIAMGYSFTYLTNAIEKVLNDVENIELMDLEKYVNALNCIFIGEGVKTLVVRPFEMEALSGREAVIINGFAQLLDAKEVTIATLTKHLSEEQISPGYLEKMFQYDRDRSIKFAGIMTQYTEIFFSYLKATFEMMKFDPRMDILNTKAKLRVIVSSFFEISLLEGLEVSEEFKEKLIKELGPCL